MQKILSARTVLSIEYAGRLADPALKDHHIASIEFVTHGADAARKVAGMFIEHGYCNEDATPALMESFKHHLAALFSRAVNGAAKMEGISAQASLMLIDLDPAHSRNVVRALAAIVGADLADTEPDTVNRIVDQSADPETLAKHVGESRRMVAQMAE